VGAAVKHGPPHAVDEPGQASLR